MIKLTPSQITVDAAAVGELPRRSISGIAVTYDEIATVADGTKVRIMQGALPVDGRNPKLYGQHDSSQILGMVTEREDTPEGMMFVAKISATRLGDEYLTLANDGVIDSVSVGINPTKFSYDEDGVMIVETADWTELSMVSQGAFSGAVITDVAASIPQTESRIELNELIPTQEKIMIESVEPTVEVAATVEKLWAKPARKFDLPTAGEYMAAMHIGGETFRNVQAATAEFVNTKRSALEAAAGDVITTDTPGLLPVPVLGPVMANLGYQRPVVTAIGARAMPDGGNQKTFIRPTWTTHVSVGAQSTELSAVSATTPLIASNVITKTTLSGQVTFSVQDIDFTSPASMDIIMQDLVGQYMLQSDAVACNAITNGGSASGSTWTVTANDPSTLISAMYDAATDILSATNFLPDTVFVSPDVWKKLGSQLDGDKRPVFPYTGAAGLMGVNGIGTSNVTVANTFNPFGLNLVADRAFADNTLTVAKANAIEFYEQVRGLLSVEVPSTLGRTFSYYGYVATFIPYNSMVKEIVVSG